MTEYLITDARTNAAEWVAAPTVREAVLTHANARRAVAMPANTKASRYSQGDLVDVSIGDSVCRGLRANVVRAATA